MIKLLSFQGCKDDSTHIQQRMKQSTETDSYENHIITSTEAENAFNKAQHPFMIKVMKKYRITRKATSDEMVAIRNETRGSTLSILT